MYLIKKEELFKMSCNNAVSLLFVLDLYVLYLYLSLYTTSTHANNFEWNWFGFGVHVHVKVVRFITVHELFHLLS